MGCCCSNKTTETTSLLANNNQSESNTSKSWIRKKSRYNYSMKPKCKCGEFLHLYELQCCYLGPDGNTFTGTIDCAECMVGMTESTTLLWHCDKFKQHNFQYDLCCDCADKLYENEQKEAKENEHKQEYKYNLFDTKYNDYDIDIDWNKMYEIMIDDGKIFIITEKINNYIQKYNNWQNILPQNILQFITHCQSKEILANSSHFRCHKHDDWTMVVNDVDNISIWYKKEDGIEMHSLKSKILMKCTALDILAVLNEYDLMSELISLVPIDTNLVKEISIVSKIIHLKVHLWFPLKNRDGLAKVEAFDVLDKYGEIIICGKSIDGKDVELNDLEKNNLPNDVLQVDSKTVRVDVNQSEGCLIPLQFAGLGGAKEHLTECISILNIDPKSYMPKTLLNYFNRTLAFYAAKMIRHRCENLHGTKHAKRVATKDIYRKWKREMKEYVTKIIADKNHVMYKTVKMKANDDDIQEINEQKEEEEKED